MPPSQWLRERHSRSSGGSDSTASITVAPVVVKPEADSKNASAKLG